MLLLQYFYIDTLNHKLRKKVVLHVPENSFVKTLVKFPLFKKDF